MTDLETFKEARERISELAGKAFKNHMLTEEGEGRWRCAKPGTGMYSFRVITAPGTVCYFGDLGEVILECSEREVLPWLRGVVGRSPFYLDYLLSKVRAADTKTHFYAGDALARVRECCEEERWPGLLEDVKHQLESEPTDQREFSEMIYDRTGDTELCGVGVSHSSTLIWFAEAMRLFIRLHDEKLALDTASGNAGG